MGSLVRPYGSYEGRVWPEPGRRKRCCRSCRAQRQRPPDGQAGPLEGSPPWRPRARQSLPNLVLTVTSVRGRSPARFLSECQHWRQHRTSPPCFALGEPPSLNVQPTCPILLSCQRARGQGAPPPGAVAEPGPLPGPDRSRRLEPCHRVLPASEPLFSSLAHDPVTP